MASCAGAFCSRFLHWVDVFRGFTPSRGGAHRRPANHNPPWPPLPNNPRWDYFNTIMSTSDFTQPTGLSIFAMIQALQACPCPPRFCPASGPAQTCYQ